MAFIHVTFVRVVLAWIGSLVAIGGVWVRLAVSRARAAAQAEARFFQREFERAKRVVSRGVASAGAEYGRIERTAEDVFERRRR